jgi:hypothetical protein
MYVWMNFSTYLFVGVFMNLLMHLCAYVYMDERTYELTHNSQLRHLFTHKNFYTDLFSFFLNISFHNSSVYNISIVYTLIPECTPKIPSILNSSQPSTLALLIARQAIVEVREGVEAVWCDV